jgi:hypothetical protein
VRISADRSIKPKMIEMADEGELDGLSEPVNEEFDRTN